jgi:hypothetical protein
MVAKLVWRLGFRGLKLGYLSFVTDPMSVTLFGNAEVRGEAPWTNNDTNTWDFLATVQVYILLPAQAF